MAREAGHTPIIYTLRDSILDIEAKKQKFETLYHTGRVQTSFVRWHKLRNLPSILRSKDIQIVHCYALNFMWPMAFFLRGMPHIPLFLTQSREVKKRYRSFLYRLLSSRIDQVFIPFSPLAKNVKGQLGVPSKKIISLGYGVDSVKSDRSEIDNLKQTWQKGIEVAPLDGEQAEENPVDTWSVGAYVPMHLKDIETLKTIVYATMGMDQKLPESKTIRLIFYNEKNWSETLIYPDLIRFVKDLGVEELIHFYSGVPVETFQQAVDVWLASTAQEQLDDLSIQAIMQGIPILVPRSISSMEIFRLYGPIGESFKRDDPRQLRDQCLKILFEKKHYTRLLKNALPKFQASFGPENYSQTLLHFYLHSAQVRKRYSRHRELSV